MKKLVIGAATICVIAYASVATFQARAVGQKAKGIRTGMTFAQVSQQVDGWDVINAHPLGRGTQNRANPGPEYFGYSGDVHVLTPVTPDGRETDLRKIQRAEFERRLDTLLSDGEPWTVYFSFRTIGRDTGVMVQFDGSGRVVDSQ